jgi:hypothetical protein
MYIYKTTIIPTNEIYIGQSIHKPEETTDYLGSGKILKAKVNYYGIENCKKTILIDDLDNKADLDFFEKVLIEANREDFGDLVINIADGGGGGVGTFKIHKQDCKCSFCKAKRGELKGKSMSEQTKQKMRISANNPEVKEKKRQAHLGQKCTEETKLKIKQSNLGQKRSEQTKEKNRLSHLGKPIDHKLTCQCFICKSKRGEMKGKIVSEQAKENIRLSHLKNPNCQCCMCKSKRGERKGIVLSEQHKKNLRKPKSEQGKANMKLAQNRPEVKEKIRQTRLGKPRGNYIKKL